MKFLKGNGAFQKSVVVETYSEEFDMSWDMLRYSIRGYCIHFIYSTLISSCTSLPTHVLRGPADCFWAPVLQIINSWLATLFISQPFLNSVKTYATLPSMVCIYIQWYWKPAVPLKPPVDNKQLEPNSEIVKPSFPTRFILQTHEDATECSQPVPKRRRYHALYAKSRKWWPLKSIRHRMLPDIDIWLIRAAG